MLTVLSPAKSLNLSPTAVSPTAPRWPEEAARLARILRGLGLRDLRALMDISDDLARLNRDRFRTFADVPGPDAVKPAVLAFDGDTYKGLDAPTLDDDALRWAQGHLRILSGLYGLLRPLDAVQPYRLEMGSRLKTRRGATLYDFWGDKIARQLNADAADAGTDILVNCASQEYFAAAARPSLRLHVISPVFLEVKAGQASIVSFWAKRARGAMARYIVENRLTDPAALRDFRAGGYAFDPEASAGDRLVFTRAAPEPADLREK